VRWLARNTFTKSARAKIIVASIWFPMRCHSLASGTASRMQPATLPLLHGRMVTRLICRRSAMLHGNMATSKRLEASCAWSNLYLLCLLYQRNNDTWWPQPNTGPIFQWPVKFVRAWRISKCMILHLRRRRIYWNVRKRVGILSQIICFTL